MITKQLTQTNAASSDVAALVAEVERLRGIVGCVVRTLDRMDYGFAAICETVQRSEVESIEPDPISGVTWGKVAYVCGLGSRSAINLCQEFGVNAWHDKGASNE